MKHLILFEDFINNQVEYIHAKMDELQDVMPVNIDFEYNIESKKENSNEQGLLKIHISIMETGINLNWTVDLDTPHITFIAEGEDIFGDDISEDSYDQEVSSVEEALDMIEKQIYSICDISERVKAQRYKGRKIPGKYLTKNPGKMKKEIDTFRGKKEYKKDWDADYSSGKGGQGKRVKTKKSAATKAYQRMFGDK
jgi:hypothetical protein